MEPWSKRLVFRIYRKMIDCPLWRWHLSKYIFSYKTFQHLQYTRHAERDIMPYVALRTQHSVPPLLDHQSHVNSVR